MEPNGYGIFQGQPPQWAHLWFSAERARWVLAERWHQRQRMKKRTDGSLELTFPYCSSTELIGDILRHGRHCRVIAPASLRDEVQAEIAVMQAGYSD